MCPFGGWILRAPPLSTRPSHGSSRPVYTSECWTYGLRSAVRARSNSCFSQTIPASIVVNRIFHQFVCCVFVWVFFIYQRWSLLKTARHWGLIERCVSMSKRLPIALFLETLPAPKCPKGQCRRGALVHRAYLRPLSHLAILQTASSRQSLERRYQNQIIVTQIT